MVVFTGSMSAGALAWGLLAEGLGVANYILSRGGRVGGRRYCRSCLVGAGDREPGPRAGCLQGEPRLAFDPAPDAGPVLVTVEYIVTPEREADFLEATADLRQSRLRTEARAGSSTATESDPIGLSRSSACRRGRSTCVSTKAA